MLLAGDECRRTQRGNNNAYCQDNDMSWFDWKLVEKNEDWCASAGADRIPPPAADRAAANVPQRPARGRSSGLPDVSWFNALGNPVRLAFPRFGLHLPVKPPRPNTIQPALAAMPCMLVNPTIESREFILPPVAKGIPWRLFVDTAEASPDDIYPDQDGPQVPKNGRLTLPYRSLCCYVASS